MVQQSTTGALERGCVEEYYRSTGKAVLVQQGIIGAFDRELLEHSRGCAGTAEYCKSTRETVLVQRSTIGALGRLFWYRLVQ